MISRDEPDGNKPPKIVLAPFQAVVNNVASGIGWDQLLTTQPISTICKLAGREPSIFASPLIP